jgi:hypothetical protein
MSRVHEIWARQPPGTLRACTGIAFLLPWDESSQQHKSNLAEITATLIEYSRQGIVYYMTISSLDFVFKQHDEFC